MTSRNALGSPWVLAGGVIAYIGSINFWSGTPVATPNYGYEKRQRELAKKRKKEEKLKAKAERKVGPPGQDGGAGGEEGGNNQPPTTPAGH